MFIIFFYSSFCLNKHTFDYINRECPKEIELYINPMELVEINVRKGMGSFFHEWYTNQYISIEIESQNADGSTRTRGPYDANSLLAGAVFQKKDYKIILYNDGPSIESVSIAFAEDFSVLINEKYRGSFPAQWLFNEDDSFDSLSNPIIFNYDHQNAVWGIAVLLPILVVVYVFYSIACH